jgi:hypothetical protein
LKCRRHASRGRSSSVRSVRSIRSVRQFRMRADRSWRRDGGAERAARREDRIWRTSSCLVVRIEDRIFFTDHSSNELGPEEYLCRIHPFQRKLRVPSYGELATLP